VSSVDIVGDADPLLANAATIAVQQWEFTPTYLDNEPIEVRMKVNVSFSSNK
jgi:hypothetical protein